MNRIFSCLFPCRLLHFFIVALSLGTSRSQILNNLRCWDYPLSLTICFILFLYTHGINDHMETNICKDRLNRLRLRSDDRDDPYDRDDCMETRLKASVGVAPGISYWGTYSPDGGTKI